MPCADLKCWAFSPPGGLVSETLLPALRDWCISVVCGKDAVPRMTTNNLARLMDEMVTALARARWGVGPNTALALLESFTFVIRL
jgi:sn1-specific diacylglycerol lipase